MEAEKRLIGSVVSSRCQTYPPTYRVLGFSTKLSQLTLSDQWFGPHACTLEVVGSTPGSATFPFAVCDRKYEAKR